MGLPRHPGGARGHRHGHDPFGPRQALERLPNHFRWPPFRSVKRVVQRLTVALLVSATLVQLITGFLNVLNWRPFRWDFVSVHYYLAYVVVGSVLLHIAVKLPDIIYGLQTKIAEGDVLTEVPWNENPESHSIAGPLPPPLTPGLSRRGVLTAAGAGIGVVVVTSVGQALTPLEPLGLLAPASRAKALWVCRWTRRPRRPR